MTTLNPAQKAAIAARKASALIDPQGPSRPADISNPYLKRKQVTLPKNTSLRDIDLADVVRIIGYAPKCDDGPLQGRLLVVPVYINSILSTVELIDEAGRKSAIAGGPKGGGYWSTAPLPDCDWLGDLAIVIGEGMATVVSASMATGYLGVAALCCGNLLAVAKLIRERYPEAKIVLLADLGNGQPKAIEAARAVDGYVATPSLPQGIEGK